MNETEQRLQQEVEELLRRAAAVDEAEDAQYGKGKRGDELPEELARRESRIEAGQQIGIFADVGSPEREYIFPEQCLVDLSVHAPVRVRILPGDAGAVRVGDRTWSRPQVHPVGADFILRFCR